MVKTFCIFKVDNIRRELIHFIFYDLIIKMITIKHYLMEDKIYEFFVYLGQDEKIHYFFHFEQNTLSNDTLNKKQVEQIGTSLYHFMDFQSLKQKDESVYIYHFMKSEHHIATYHTSDIHQDKLGTFTRSTFLYLEANVSQNKKFIVVTGDVDENSVVLRHMMVEYNEIEDQFAEMHKRLKNNNVSLHVGIVVGVPKFENLDLQ